MGVYYVVETMRSVYDRVSSKLVIGKGKKRKGKTTKMKKKHKISLKPPKPTERSN